MQIANSGYRLLPVALLMLALDLMFITGGFEGEVRIDSDVEPSGPRTHLTDPQLVGDGVADETAALQAMIDRAQAGSVLRLPNPVVEYRISSPLHIDKALTITTEGRARIPIRQGSAGADGIVISSSNVGLERLELVGSGYRGYRPEVAVRVNTTERLTNIFLRNSKISDWSGSAVRWTGVDGFSITGNDFERCTYAGVLLISVTDGSISANRVNDIGNPPVGQPLGNSYGIVVTSIGDMPYSDLVTISNNNVHSVPGWAGIMNHGGTNILIDSNVVVNADVGLANTWVKNSGQTSDDTTFVNNVVTGSTRNAAWITGPDWAMTSRVRFIGNKLLDSGPIAVFNQNDAVLLHNEFRFLPAASTAVVASRVNTNLALAHNSWQPAHIDLSPKTHLRPLMSHAPPQALWLRVVADETSLDFNWTYQAQAVHDGFVIDERRDGIWRRLAVRPPSFAADSTRNNGTIESFSYRHLLTRKPADAYRIRAISGGHQSTTLDAEFSHSANVSLPLTAHEAAVSRLYSAYFGRVPDAHGLIFWLGSGLDVPSISAVLLDSEEFRSRFGPLSDSDFLTLMYQQVLLREPDEPGFQYWRSQLLRGLGRAQFVAHFSDSKEHRSRLGHPL